MEKSVKDTWLSALRSGEYEQGRGCLRSDDNRFCCLGVLADILDPNGWDFDEVRGQLHDGKRNWLSPKWRTAAGFSDGEVVPLMNMNDNGKPFAEIADYIEEHL